MSSLDWKDDQSYTLCEQSESEYEIVNTPKSSIADSSGLPLRAKLEDQEATVRVEVHETVERDGILVSITPPREPTAINGRLHHVACDIVLTIDVSGSMNAEAPPPVENFAEAERNGLTVLDLVKHAAHTILETLDYTDRLAIVIFSTEAKIVQRLLPMTAENKVLTSNNIKALQPDSMTNLWHGILESIKVFDNDERSNCVPAIMVLTDGLPNHMCPKQGYVRKLRSYKLPASLHTFGFGFSLRSGLLKSIAEVGGGNYAFISDAGMLGTVFIHSVANLQSTFATNVTLTLTTAQDVELIDPTISQSTGIASSEDTSPIRDTYSALPDQPRKASAKIHGKPKSSTISLAIDSLQYGQSRDIILKYKGTSASFETSALQCRLVGRPVDGTILEIFVEDKMRTGRLSNNVFVYHKARTELCSLLNSIFPLNSLEEHQVASDITLEEFCTEFEKLAAKLRNEDQKDARIRSLWEDLVGPDPAGQIRLAASTTAYFDKWGKHYLLSVLNAHQRQICNSFKDNGPLQYGINSPLFIQCRDNLDRAFDSLPPPVPSRQPRTKAGQTQKVAVDMRKYHRRDNPCFAGHSLVTLHDGSRIQVHQLRAGMQVRTMKGFADVVAVVATNVYGVVMCITGDMAITSWHPICVGGSWSFPVHEIRRSEHYTGTIYSIMLGRCDDPDMHTIELPGCWAATLGHGVLEAMSDTRSHDFFGDYDAIEQSLGSLAADASGVLWCAGIERNIRTGLACGFQPCIQAQTLPT